MKAFLALGVRKSVPEELIFAKSKYFKSDFVNFAKFGFLTNFLMVNRFLMFLLIVSLSPLLPILSGAF